MASKRMFSLTVADTDLFLDMPSSSQALYFHLGLRADDDGFVASPKKIAKISGIFTVGYKWICTGTGAVDCFGSIASHTKANERTRSVDAC